MTIKLGASLAIGLVAAMTALIAGMMTDARMETAATRAVKCFFLSGLMVLAMTFLVDWIVNRFFTRKADEDDEEEAEDTDALKAEEAVTEPSKTSEQAENSSPDGFVPLGADNLRRVSTQ